MKGKDGDILICNEWIKEVSFEFLFNVFLFDFDLWASFSIDDVIDIQSKLVKVTLLAIICKSYKAKIYS